MRQKSARLSLTLLEYEYDFVSAAHSRQLLPQRQSKPHYPTHDHHFVNLTPTGTGEAATNSSTFTSTSRGYFPDGIVPYWSPSFWESVDLLHSPTDADYSFPAKFNWHILILELIQIRTKTAFKRTALKGRLTSPRPLTYFHQVVGNPTSARDENAK